MSAVPIIVTLLFSLGLSALTMPWFIRKMEAKGQMVTDYYKPGKTPMANNGGILTLFVVFVTIILVPLIFRLLVKFDMDFPRTFSEADTAILMVILLYAFYGVLDDYIDVGRFSKIIIPLMFAYPFVIVLTGWNPWVPFAGIMDLSSFDIAAGSLGTLTGSMMLRYIVTFQDGCDGPGAMDLRGSFGHPEALIPSPVLLWMVLENISPSMHL